MTPLQDFSAGRRWRVLAGVCLASAAMPMTFTGPAVALREIAAGLGDSPVALAWVTNAFMLAFGSFLMVAGALADRHGRRRVFVCGVVGFIGTSMALLAAPGIVVFDLLRGLQGLASAAVFAGGAATLAQEFDGPVRLRAFSMLGTSFGIGLTLGPLAAGWLTAAWGWRAIFLLVIGCATVALLIARPAMRESRDPAAHALDWPGALTFTLTLSIFTWGVLQAPERGWSSASTIGSLGAAAVFLAWFVRIERRTARPMLDLDLFRYPHFVGVQLLAAAPAYGFVVLLVLLPIRFVGIEGMGSAQAGLAMMALSAPLVVLPLVAGLLAQRVRPGMLCGGGLLAAAAGLVWLAGAHDAHAALAPMLLIGAGISLPWGLMDGLAVSVVPRERAGMATGIFSTTRVAGEGLALAIVGAGLSALAALRLAPLGCPVPTSLIAQRLVAGDLAGAAAQCPTVPAQILAHAFQDAFSTLALVLAAVTTLTALVVFVFLARGAETGASSTLAQPS
ncbi:MFS transporter [Paucibacter sp. R3-3]|uniref:MFS transporter n=1 Tax=Roseateles agri TaxID=3098619 RepID=A0ABU5DGT5_9BURK|nr:MFS transporter [Paucibacter sp. R3-3]MDY0745502.1 MFS transporter [Paucibacter sp. R3-3]